MGFRIYLLTLEALGHVQKPRLQVVVQPNVSDIDFMAQGRVGGGE